MKKILKRISFSGLMYNAIIPAIMSAGNLLLLVLLFAFNCVASFGTPSNAAMAGVNKEIWLPELKENFYPEADWLAGVEDMSAFVEYNTLNLAAAGVDPTVYINNSSFPLTATQRTDAAIALPLDTFLTQPTIVRSVEEMESAYDKRGSVIRQHQLALRTKCYDRAAYYWGPTSNSADHPVIATTGADDGNGYKSLSMADLLQMQYLFNVKNFPTAGRKAVLHNAHLMSLLAANITLFNQYVNLKEGQPLRFAGWDIYTYSNMPVYNKSSLTKAAWAAAAAPSTDSPSASIFFCNTEVMKADGTFDMFTRINDPYEAGDIVNFQKRFLALSIRNKAQGAIVSVVA